MLLIGMIERLLANDRTAATNRSDPPWWSLKYDGVRRESSNQYISRFLAKVQIEQEYVSHSRLAFSFASESHLFLSLFIILSIFVPYYLFLIRYIICFSFFLSSRPWSGIYHQWHSLLTMKTNEKKTKMAPRAAELTYDTEIQCDISKENSHYREN